MAVPVFGLKFTFESRLCGTHYQINSPCHASASASAIVNAGFVPLNTHQPSGYLVQTILWKPKNIKVLLCLPHERGHTPAPTIRLQACSFTSWSLAVPVLKSYLRACLVVHTSWGWTPGGSSPNSILTGSANFFPEGLAHHHNQRHLDLVDHLHICTAHYYYGLS